MAMMGFVSIVGHIGPALLALSLPGGILWLIKAIHSLEKKNRTR